MVVAEKKPTRRRRGKASARRDADRELEMELIWALYARLARRAYGLDLQEPNPVERKTLEHLSDRSYQSHREVCRRIKRAFADKARVRAGIELATILQEWVRLAA